MVKCGRCLTENPDTGRFCNECASPLAPNSPASMIPTEAAPTASAVSRPRSRPISSTTSDTSEDGRFVPGTLLGDRYRIVSLLGAGGMGEVYRATDLRLGQQVALKFLPDETARDPKTLARFHNEVRIARQVAHPNVCRVYDLGEVEGYAYLSMEYVDGEDLHSLLRRIGRLPPDKAAEIARKLCAGLAAAHDKGVLHRDLKPANIMIDGRGNVLITDFGLAGAIGQIEGAEARNGTPGYMAPEQLSGKEVSAQSDIYALGVVLYEMFTGKRPFPASNRAELIRLTEEGLPPAPHTIVKDIDPAVESVILRCLAPDPAHRPRTALSVLAALPGGDPLAAALAAGETPSPEMVAASGQKTGLRQKAALAWLAGAIVLLAAFAVLNDRCSLLARIPLDKPPDVLVERAREIAQSLGYSDRGSAATGVDYRWGGFAFLNKANVNEFWARLASRRPPVFALWYRTSPHALVPRQILDIPHVTLDDPPEQVPGMFHVVVDPQGRLIHFTAVPPEYENSPGPGPAPDWSVLFAAAGLDFSRFKPAPTQRTPPVMADTRAAWTGTYTEAPDIPVRVEAAAFHGKPVHFAELLGLESPGGGSGSSGRSTGALVYLGLELIVLLGSFPIARYNLKRGRGDTKGALRLALFVCGASMATWLVGGSHVAGVGEADLFFQAVMRSLFNAVTIALTYLSFEPFVRRKWPQTIVSWSRVLAGGFRDPLVGRDVLLGTCIAVSISFLLASGHVVSHMRGIPAMHAPALVAALLGGRHTAGQFLFLVVDTLTKSLGILFLIFLLRALLRIQWLAAGLVIVALASMEAINAPDPLIGWSTNLIMFGLMVFTLMRFGLVALAVEIFVSLLLGQFPVTTNFSAWYFGEVVFVLLTPVALAVYGFRTALAGRTLFGHPEGCAVLD